MIADLISRQIDGLLLASVDVRSTRLANLRRVGLAAVMIDCPVPVPGYVSIGSNARAGSQRVVEHLIEVHSHSVIALVVGEGVPGADQREQGWQSATRSAGLPDGPLARTSFSREGGYEAANRLLDTRNPPTAIFASSDLQAVGALRAIRERGLSVPEDVAVVAFDGTKESEFTWPPMTVARQPIREMAVSAVQKVLSPPLERVGCEVFEMDLVIRQSCGCSPSPKGT